MNDFTVQSYIAGRWTGPARDSADGARRLFSAITGEQIGLAGSNKTDIDAIRPYALEHGGPALRACTFHQRAKQIKALALYLDQHKEQLYTLSHISGATLEDAKIDVDGGIATLFVYASKGRRELPDATVLVDGDVEMLSRSGSFIGQHIARPKPGIAVHINAFNFPVWGMLEKLAQSLLGGVPAVVKPATSTCYITEACFRLMIDSGALPNGAVQLLIGGTGSLLDQLSCQDLVSFTGSASTALKLRGNPHLLRDSVPFIAEQDSLNATVLGPDAQTGSAEFGILVDEVVREISAKAGQKCTAIRRILVPAKMLDSVAGALTERFSALRIGDPANANTQMGALVSGDQKKSVLDAVTQLQRDAELLTTNANSKALADVSPYGAFVEPMLLQCKNPDSASSVHQVEAFGPVATLMPYRTVEHASELLNRGGGSLVASLITHDTSVAQTIAAGSAAFHGRLYINNRDSLKESTGHGSPMPHMTHGGPGRAGGGEELGGIRGVQHYLQRTAIQGSPDMVAAIAERWIPGAATTSQQQHPFRRTFEQLQAGDTMQTGSRTISIDDIEKFAHFTGDTFYAHMDEQAAAASPFFEGRVAHGYLLLAFAAGLFVEPSPGPVLANTGLERLQFFKPVSAGDSISVALTVKRKTHRTDTYGEVRWHVSIANQHQETVAEYELHTMNSYV